MERQVVETRKAKEQEKRKEQEYMLSLQDGAVEQQRRDKLKVDEMKRKLDAEKVIRDMQLKELSERKE